MRERAAIRRLFMNAIASIILVKLHGGTTDSYICEEHRLVPEEH